jgi:hypothetical protein
MKKKNGMSLQIWELDQMECNIWLMAPARHTQQFHMMTLFYLFLVKLESKTMMTKLHNNNKTWPNLQVAHMLMKSNLKMETHIQVQFSNRLNQKKR